ncbi:MAG: ClpX C4-type zinc finger protein [Arthrobacter sp.]|nr:ClpX C4-type zinc finger protein [Arthrobacter sp.]
MNDGDSDRRQCSFCGRGGAPDRRLVAGPGICICEHCVDTARELLDFTTDGSAPAAGSLGPAWEQLSDEEILRHLPEISHVGSQLEEQLKRWVGAARERNVSWSRIGAALGITRQTAWERFKNPA